MDAGFTIGKIMDGLKARGIRFVGQLRTNPVLERLPAPCLTRPAGRPPKEGYESTVELGCYQAEDWTYPQRVVLVVVEKPDPKTGQLVRDELLRHYGRRGTFEDRPSE